MRHERRLRGPERRAGFTLLELALVMGLLLMLAGLAWPSFESMFRYQRLATGAEQFANALRDARRQAIEDGVAYRVDVAFGVGVYRTRLGADPWTDAEGEEPPTNVEGTGGEEAWSPTRVEDELSQGLRFLEPPQNEDLVAGAAAPQEPTIEPPIEDAVATEARPWFEFYPDGSASDGALFIADESSDFVEIRVWGLSGEVEISDIRQKESEEEPPSDWGEEPL